MTRQHVARAVDAFDARFTGFLARWSLPFLRVSLGVVFLWFGALKLFPGQSPAEALVADTTRILFFGLVPERAAVAAIGAWEVAIGAGLLAGRWLRLVLALLALQMVGAFSPLVLFPLETFVRPPLTPTLEGQYILKNVVLVAAALVLGSTVRTGQTQAGGGRTAPDQAGFQPHST